MKTYRILSVLISFSFVFIFYGCSSGGGDSSAVPDPLPQISIEGVSLLEGDSGTKSAVFVLTMDAQVNDIVTIDYSSSNGTAISGSDFVALSGTLQFDAMQTSKILSVTIMGDTNTEIAESFILSLSNVSINAQLANSSAVGVIMNDDGQFLNDTGSTLCSDTTNNFLNCPQSGFPGQDSELGRDVQSVVKTGAGRLGFDFTKLDDEGLDLPVSTTSWSCVRDNVTGLIWEVKDVSGTMTGIQSAGDTYTWYNTDNTTNGGNAGTPDGGNCSGGINCDTDSYVQAINQLQLCGYNDWRLPKQTELLSIYDYESLSIDSDYFPSETSSYNSWWSSVTSAFTISSAHMLWTGTGSTDGDSTGMKSHSNGIRVVRSGL